jgi:hypothetical protein
MPKITHVPYRIDKQDIDFTIAYSVKRRIFYVTLPRFIAGVLGCDIPEIIGDTQREAENNLHKAIEEYGKRKATEQKVIFYTFASMVRPIDFDDLNTANGLSELCTEGVALDLWFRVGYIIRNPTDFQETYLLENREKPQFSSKLGQRWVRYMSYTKEREVFFMKFREWLVEGIEKMSKFFKETELPVLMDELVRNRKALPFKDSP